MNTQISKKSKNPGRYMAGIAIVTALLFLSGCNASEQVPAQSSAVTSLLTPTTAPSPTNSPTPSPSPTLSPTPTPSPSPTPSPTPTPDTEPPALTLLGDSCVEVIARSEYTEPGFVAEDACDGDLTLQVQVSGEVDVNWCGTYTLTYEVADLSGNIATAERTVVVKQPDEIIPEGKVIYLTFDDGPGQYTEELLSILEKYDIKATFFTCLNGRPDLVTKIHEAGHTVAIHCQNHDYDVVYASEEAYFNDLFAMQDAIYECTGIRTTLVRFPGGSSNTVSRFNPGIMSRLAELLTQMGFQYFDWNVDSGDITLTSAEDVLAKMKKDVAAKSSYSVILQHAETRTVSIKAVEDFILWALGNDYTFLPLEPTSPRIHHNISN